MAYLVRRPGRKNFYVEIAVPDGQPIRRSLKTDDERIAQQRVDRLNDRIAAAARRLPGQPTCVSELWEPYHALVKNEKAPRTLELELTCLRAMERVLGDLPLLSLDESHGRAFRDKCIKQKLSPVTIETYMKRLSIIFDGASKGRLIAPVNPFAGVPRPRPTRNAIRYLEVGEINRVLTEGVNLDLDMWVASVLGILGGFRKAETDHSQWPWLHFDERYVEVTRVGEWVPKHNSERELVMYDKLRWCLEPLAKPEGPIIAPLRRNPSRNRWRYRYDFRDRFQDFFTALELPWVTTHTLRHTFAMQSLRHGVGIYQVKEALGHKSVVTTEKYLHRLGGRPIAILRDPYDPF